jgi:CheY-like chemotaxis protein
MPARLLLADDSITIQRVIVLTFADEDIAVTTVGDGDAAIAALDASPPDVVLADIGMPGRTGYEVAEHVRRTPALAHIPVLLLTGASEPADEARVRALGCAGVLVKPFEPQMVIARVRDVLGARASGLTRPPAAPAAEPEGAIPPPAAPAGAASPARDVDAYFEQLDAAFAKLASATQPPVGVREPITSGEAAPGAPRPAPVTMAGAFEALLGAEQGEPLPPPLVQVAAERRRQQDLAARVAADVAEQVVREIAPEIVSQIAERLVREEIERLKASTSAP